MKASLLFNGHPARNGAAASGAASLAAEFKPARAPFGSVSALAPAWRNAVFFLGITVLAVLYQLRWGTIPDTSWLITVCERVLDGDRLYVDIVETNPPFTIWLYLPPVALARALGIAPEILVHALSYLAALAGLFFAGRILRAGRFPETASLVALAPAFYAMLVIFPGNAFSQREHIGMALFVPLLVLVAWRARRDGAPPRVGIAVLAGLSGSVLLLLKPHYAVMVLLPVLFAVWRRRSLRPVFSVENWVIGVVCCAYLAAVLTFHPEYLRDVYPLVADTYLRIHSVLPIVLNYGPRWIFLMALVWLIWPRGTVPELASVATFASIAALVPLLAQGKGWPYHAFAALLCAVFALLCLHALAPADRRHQGRTGRSSLAGRAIAALVLAGIVFSYTPFWATEKPAPGLISPVRAATDHPSVALIGANIADGHPFNRMVGGRWIADYGGDWLFNIARYLSTQAARAGNSTEAARYDAIAERYARAKRGEFARARPDIVLLRRGRWAEALFHRFGFDAVLASYHVIAEDSGSVVYLRNGYTAAPADD
ncbi:MAG: hypothetical protein Q8Q62_02030 [Mesorhizobium sp.]|nr:hypothetical protein [Mesorhizobium sp.]